jgi:hypothetical protein
LNVWQGGVKGTVVIHREVPKHVEYRLMRQHSTATIILNSAAFTIMRFIIPIAALALSAAAIPTGGSTTPATSAVEPSSNDSGDIASLADDTALVTFWMDFNRGGDYVFHRYILTTSWDVVCRKRFVVRDQAFARIRWRLPPHAPACQDPHARVIVHSIVVRCMNVIIGGIVDGEHVRSEKYLHRRTCDVDRRRLSDRVLFIVGFVIFVRLSTFRSNAFEEEGGGSSLNKSDESRRRHRSVVEHIKEVQILVSFRHLALPFINCASPQSIIRVVRYYALHTFFGMRLYGCGLLVMAEHRQARDFRASSQKRQENAPPILDPVSGLLSELGLGALTPRSKDHSRAIEDHIQSRLEQRDEDVDIDAVILTPKAHKRHVEERGLVGGLLGPLTGIMSALDVPTPQESGLKAIPGDDPEHQYIPPGHTDVRGLCPTLNTLANHGYLNRTCITTFAEAANAI